MDISKVNHRNESRICVRFPYNQVLIAKIKAIPGAKWSKTLNAWHLPWNADSLKSLERLEEVKTSLLTPLLAMSETKPTGIGAVLKQAVSKAGVKKKVTVHTLHTAPAGPRKPKNDTNLYAYYHQRIRPTKKPTGRLGYLRTKIYV